MSKPNLLGFSTSIGFYRNQRTRNLREKLLEKVKKTVQFGDLAPMLFQAVMAYASENQLDGDFSGYSPTRFQEVFTGNFIEMTVEEATITRELLNSVGFFEPRDKIRNWNKFNRHLGDYEKIRKDKAKAARFMHKKRENDLKAASKAAKSETKAETNGHAERPAAPEPEKTQQPAKQPSPTARMLAIKEQMEGHGGAPNARNAPTDAADRSLAQSEYRVLKRTYEDLRAEVGGVSKKKPQHQATA